MKNPGLALIAVIILGMACSTENSQQPINKKQIQQKVTSMFNSYVDQMNTQGIKGVKSYFSKDDRFYWVEDGKLQYPNRDSLAASLNQFAPQVDSLNMQVATTKVHVISKNYATLYAKYNEYFALKSGHKFTLDGALTILLTKEKAGWKFLQGHSSIKKPRVNN